MSCRGNGGQRNSVRDIAACDFGGLELGVEQRKARGANRTRAQRSQRDGGANHASDEHGQDGSVSPHRTQSFRTRTPPFERGAQQEHRNT